MHQTKELIPEGLPRRISEAPLEEDGRLPKGKILLALLILAAAVCAAILVRTSAAGRLRQETRESAALPVAVVHPLAGAGASEISLPGSAQPFQDAAIYARTSGYLKAWTADIGARVKEGQVLAEIEAPEVDQQLEQARAGLKNAQANFSLSEITAARAEGLFKRSTISSQERDQAASDLAAKKALVSSGEANVRRLEQMKSFQTVVAPFAGVITARSTDIGALIQAGDSGSGRELFHLSDNHILRVYFSVPEIYASTIRPDEKVEITFDAYPGEKFPGALVRDSAAIDPRSHTLMAEADVENASGRLFPGGYATVHLKLPPLGGAVTIPANTLLFRSEGMCVAVVRANRVALVPINIGRDYGNTVEVLGSLTTADAIVIDPSDSIAEGQAVAVKSPGKPGSSPGAVILPFEKLKID